MTTRKSFVRDLTRFHVGQRVVLTAKGQRLGLQRKARNAEGCVTSFRGGWLNVRRTGTTRAEAYHPALWEPR